MMVRKKVSPNDVMHSVLIIRMNQSSLFLSLFDEPLAYKDGQVPKLDSLIIGN